MADTSLGFWQVFQAGKRFVRRHNAARTSTANATAASIDYDTSEIAEQGFTWSSPAVSVDAAGLYLTVFDLGQVDLASTRAVGTLVPRVNGADQQRFRSTHRYLRNSGGSQQGASIGMAILDLSADDTLEVRNPGALTPTDAVGNYATNASYGGALQVLALPAGNFTHVERTADAAEVGVSNINTTRPWLDSSGTWTTVTFNSEVRDDAALYPGTGGDLTLAANKKYMIVWGGNCYSTSGLRHAYVMRLQIGGNSVQTGSGYQRTTASQGPPMCGIYLHETGGSAETLRLQATQESEGGDAGTPQVADAYVQVLELPDTAEWIHADNGATDSLTTALASTTTWYDTPLSSTLRADGNSDLSLDGANNAVQNDSGDVLPVLAIGWHRWDRDAGTSGTRKNPWARWDNGGAAVGYGVAGAFSRGQQSTNDTWQAHYCSAATMDLANGADLSFQVQDEASAANSDMGVYASTSRYFLGVQVLNLATLYETPAGGAGAVSGTGSASGAASGTGVGAAIGTGEGAAAGAGTGAGESAAIMQGDGAADGVAAGVGEGAGVIPSEGGADGVAAVSGDGIAVVAGEGDASGAASVAGEGAGVGAGEGVAAGSASGSGAGGAVAAGEGAAAGGAVGSGEGAAIAAGQGDTAGAASASGAGGAVASGEGAAAGGAVGSGEGAAIAAGQGDTAGAASASGAGGAVASGEGAAAGGADGAGEGAAVALGEGAAAGVATGAGVGEGGAASDSQGTAAGVASVSGEGAATVQAEGAAAGAGSGAGEGAGVAQADGAADGGAIGTGEGAAVAASDGVAAGMAGGVGAGAAIGAAEGAAAGAATGLGVGEAILPSGGALLTFSATATWRAPGAVTGRAGQAPATGPVPGHADTGRWRRQAVTGTYQEA